MEIKPNQIGLQFHADDFELFPEQSQINKGDLLFVRDTKSRDIGRVLISETDFIDHVNNYSFNFKPNDHYKGWADKDRDHQGFARKIKTIKAVNPVEFMHAWVKEIKSNKVTVENDDKERFLIQYHSPIIGGFVGNVIWGWANDKHCDFDSYSMAGYPVNSMRL